MATLVVGEENGTPVELYFEDRGTGDPVVLIHGWPLSSRMWEAQVGPLVDAGHRVISYDRRGFGWSSQPSDGYDYDTLAADLHALLEHLDVIGATLVGFSMGGGEVARHLTTYGADRVTRAVFAAAAVPYLLKTRDNPEGVLDDAGIVQMQDALESDRLASLEGFFQVWFGGDRTDLATAAQRDDAMQIAALAFPKAMRDCLGAVARTDFRADLPKVTVPTLIIHGDADLNVPMKVSAVRAHDAIAGSELVVIEGAPHGVTVTHAEEFNRALLEFLKR
jgi:pimeloyl-ACP methyl ester carboxylesterase